MIGSVVDSVLDRTVVGGYTSAGYRLRSRGWAADAVPRMDGKVVLVTGARAGIGAAAAAGFNELGAEVLPVGRDECDISSLDSVREFAGRVRASYDRLDVVVHNAGVLVPSRQLSADGLELTFATNVAGPFLLTELLVPLLRASAPARVINVSSGGMYTQRLDVDDLQTDHREFDGPEVYARTKRAQVVLTEMWAERLAGSGIVVHAMHPGWSDTPGVRSSLPRFHRLTRPLLRTPAQGSDTIVWLGAAAEPAQTSGHFWHDRRQRPTHVLPWTRESRTDRERLWAACARLTNEQGGTNGAVQGDDPVAAHT